jgi:hypothetical protein
MEATVRMLLGDATPALQDALRDALRRAYETGFREALASAGAGGDSGAAPLRETAVQHRDVDSNGAASEVVHRLEAAPRAPVAEPSEPVAHEPDDDAESDERAAPPIDLDALDDDDWADAPSRPSSPDGAGRRGKPAITPVRPNMTVGRLRTRIVRQFALDRYDIDIVVCRKGDARRRQLRADVTLRRYLAE